MEASQTSEHHAPGRLPESLAVAVRFWEPRRLVYNLVLAGFVAAWLVGTWPHFRPAMTLPNGLRLAGLALIANALYCTSYFGEIVVQQCERPTLAIRLRSALWIAGMVLAVLLENYWIADEIYPFVN